MKTEDEFFRGKRPWSKIKDAVLRDYLPPYLGKVAKLGQQIILIDAFAGPGIFEKEKGENRLGSPLIVFQTVEKYVRGKYLAIFMNSNKNHYKKLKNTMNKLSPQKAVMALYGTAQELLEEVSKILTNQTLFIYLDPFGLKDLDFKLIEAFLQRDISYSTEIVINMSMPTLHRLATRKLHQNGKQTEQSKKLNETLTMVLGGVYWKQIMWDGSLNAEEKELKVMEKYRELLCKYLPYSGSCPVREKEEHRVKYFITFCSRHPDAMLLMNDSMCKAYFKYMHEKYYGETLFKNADWREMRGLSLIKKIILQKLKTEHKSTRKDLWCKVVQGHFMEFHSSEYKTAIKQLVDDGYLKFKNPKNTKRLNDECILFIGKRNPALNSRNSFLTREKIVDCPQLEKKSNNRIKVHFNRYKTMNNNEKILVSKVNDGSIIKRFDKTHLPKKSTDVVCPHFLELKWAYGCPYDCAWCYLKGTFRFQPKGTSPVVKPYEKIELHTRKFLEEVETPEILNTGEIADSLMHENDELPFSKFILPIFETQRLHKVLLLTKSSNVNNLLDIEPHNQAIVSFSLNSIAVAKRWEKAPSVLKRIKAAKKVFDAGYEVRIRIDPMVPIKNWQEQYLQLLDILFDNFIPERITLGSLRGLQSTINGCTDKSWVKYLGESSNWGKKIDFKMRYLIYLTIINQLRNEYSFNKVALCKETVEMWDALKMDYKKIRCNCIW